MINAQNLAVLLRALRQNDGAPRSVSATPGVARILPVQAVAPDDHSSPAVRAGTEHPAGPHDRSPTSTGQSRGIAVPPERDAALGAEAHTRGTGDAVVPATVGARIAISAAAALLHEALGSSATQSRATIRPAGTLLAAGPRDSQQLAGALRDSVAHSGLFYESHVARWLTDDYARLELAREPQSEWSTSPMGGEAGNTRATHGAASPADAAPLIREQVQALEQRQFAVVAELWPGQRATIAFAEDDGEHGAPAPGHMGSRPWCTRVEITLPSLGTVTAVIALSGAVVRCRIQAAEKQSASRLAAAWSDLAQGLQRRALDLGPCDVRSHHDE